jgi:tetratricopeptide (TPR) repeat protein
MRRRIVGWWVAFAVTALAAASLFLMFLKGPAPAAAKEEAPKLSDVEEELVLNKIREGDLQAIRGDMGAARLAWDEARRKGAGYWPIHEGLGDSLARMKLYDDAVREYLTAESLVPDRMLAARASIVCKRGDALGAAGKPIKAIQVWLELDDPARTGGRILDQVLKGDREVALDIIRRRAETHEPRHYALLSAICRKLGRYGEATEATARHLMAVAPWDENLNRGAIAGLREEKRFDLAVEVCRAWARSSPEAPEPWRLMGDLFLEAGREKEAVVAYSSIVDVRPGDAAAHRMLGDIYRKLNRGDDAIAQYEAAKKARPEDQVTYSTLVALYESKGDRSKAEETILEAVKRFGNASEFRSRLVASLQEQVTRLKVAGKSEEVRALRRKMADLNVAEAGLFDIKIIITWDAESDVDLDVIQPDGEHVKDGHIDSKAGGHYYTDNTRGYGPETYTLKTALPGTYKVGAHLHGTGRRSSVKFVVILWEDTPQEERREETLVLEKGQETRFIRDIVIAR